MSLRNWPQGDQPREKLLLHGASSLSDTELLAIFLRTGTLGKDVIQLSRELILKYGSLNKILNTNHNEFIKNKGLGTSKYVSLQASIELARRYLKERLETGYQVSSVKDTKDFLAIELSGVEQEVFCCLFMNNQNQLISFKKMFFGTINKASIHIREIVKQSLLDNAASVIVAHNHPSGNILPSKEDLQITNSIFVALQVVDINLLDHCIVGNGEVYSFSENKKMPS